MEAYGELTKQNVFELGEAFKGLRDEHVWKRPAEGLLSVGEIAGHVAYGAAVRLASENMEGEKDITKCHVKSPLVDERFRYYSHTLGAPPSQEHLAMSAEQVHRELVRVLEESWSWFTNRNYDLDAQIGTWEGFTHGASLRYFIFHVAYHTGQIYTVRHLLGETPPDN